MPDSQYRTAATAASVTDGGATETVVLTIPAPQYSFEVGSGLYISGSLQITTAASGTASVTVKVRRSSVSGTTIATFQITATTTTKYVIPFDAFDDIGGEAVTNAYVVTVAEGSAGANGTVVVVTGKVENVTP